MIKLKLIKFSNEEIIVNDVVTHNVYADGLRLAVPKEKEITFDHRVKEIGHTNKVIVPSNIKEYQVLFFDSKKYAREEANKMFGKDISDQMDIDNEDPFIPRYD
jgi:heterodisulfide reductase subunit A-like polyferredoxin